MKKLTKEQVKERDEIIFGGYEPEKYCGGCRSFAAKQNIIKNFLKKDTQIQKKDKMNRLPHRNF